MYVMKPTFPSVGWS